MTIVNEVDLSTIRLDKGSHPSKDHGMCVMEAVSWVAGENWSDHPKCVSPVIGAFCRTFNDRLDDAGRQQLAPYIFKVIGTNDGRDDERQHLAATHFSNLLPEWLDAAGLPDAAERIRALGHLATETQWMAVRDEIRAVRDLAWNKRREQRDIIKAKVREATKGKPDAAAAAAADAVADADADAVADADADAVADADADAVAAADADAAAAAAAAADADAVADAAAAAAAGPYWQVRDGVYKAVKPIYERAIAENPTLSELVERTRRSGFDLLDAMCEVGR